jgi:hypothetical protein
LGNLHRGQKHTFPLLGNLNHGLRSALTREK